MVRELLHRRNVSSGVKSWGRRMQPQFEIPIRHDGMLTADGQTTWDGQASRATPRRKAVRVSMSGPVIALPRKRSIMPEQQKVLRPQPLGYVDTMGPSAIGLKAWRYQSGSGACFPLNGAAGIQWISFDPNFETWKLLSTADRGDNNTFRFVLGNEIAVTAADSGAISPWPDGARFAKVAWQQEAGPDGLVHPGKFVQVELMLKDANHCAHPADTVIGLRILIPRCR